MSKSIINLFSKPPCIEGAGRQEDATCWMAMLSDTNVLYFHARCYITQLILLLHISMYIADPESRFLCSKIRNLGGWAIFAFYYVRGSIT